MRSHQLITQKLVVNVWLVCSVVAGFLCFLHLNWLLIDFRLNWKGRERLFVWLDESKKESNQTPPDVDVGRHDKSPNLLQII